MHATFRALDTKLLKCVAIIRSKFIVSPTPKEQCPTPKEQCPTPKECAVPLYLVSN